MIIGTYEFNTSIKILLIVCFIICIVVKTIKTSSHKTKKYHTVNHKIKKCRRKKRRKKDWKPLEHGDHTAEYIEAAWKEANK